MKRIIGIDIGSLFTKVVELEAGNRLTITNLFSFLTPYNTTVSGKIVNRSRLVKEIFQHIPLNIFKDAKVGVNVPFSSPVVITVTLPKMSRKELEIAAVTEARRKMIPAPGPKSTFETIFLGEVTEAGGPRHEMLVVKDEKDVIDSTLDLFKDTEAVPAVIAPACISTGILIAKNTDLHHKQIAFIDVGYTSMDISVSQGMNVIFSRTINFGCKDIVAGIANGLAVTNEKAEEILMEHGIPDVEFDPKNRVAIAEEIMRQKYEAGLDSDAAKQINPLELRMFLEPSLDRIIQEIRRTFIYFKERHEARKVEEILFLGGGALIKNIVTVIGKKVSPFPKVLDPVKLSNMALKDRKMNQEAQFFSSALSLAVSTTFKTHEVINFLPFELKKKEELAIRRSLLLAVCIFVMCGFLLGWLNFFFLSRNTQRSLDTVTFALERLEDVSDKERKLTSTLKAIEERTKTISTLIDTRMILSPVLAKLAAFRPAESVFTDLYIGPRQKAGAKKGKADEKKAALPLFEPSGDEPSGDTIYIALAVSIYEDYETARNIMEEYLTQLRKDETFSSLRLRASKLEEITPTIQRVDDKDAVELTQESWRDFVVEGTIGK